MKKAAALIVAAGEGRRMGGPVRKQYLPLEGMPVLAHTVRAYTSLDLFSQVIIVAPAGELKLCRGVIKPHCPVNQLQMVEGGPRRQDSVFNGLKAVGKEIELVSIHDGVRPLVTGALIKSVLAAADRYGAAIPAVAVTDTLKEVNVDHTIRATISRAKVRRAQTPQAFRRELILEAYEKAFQLGIGATDDSYLLEVLDLPVRVVPGDPINIKITGPHDLAAASAYLKGE